MAATLVKILLKVNEIYEHNILIILLAVYKLLEASVRVENMHALCFYDTHTYQ